MGKQVVAFRGVKSVLHQIPTVAVGAYKFDPKKKWVWVQRVCFYLLEKIQCTYSYNVPREVVSTFHVDGKTIAERLYKQRSEFYRHHGKEPQQVFMGSGDYHTMMGEVDSMTGFSVNLHDAYRTSYGQGYAEIHGLKLTVIPTMEGILVLP